jgi:hypothetical protein
VRQQAKELAHWSGLRVSILMAGETFDPSAPIIVASVQTLTRRYPQLLRARRPSLVLADESHHCFAGGVIDRLLRELGEPPAIGFSATPRRVWERPQPILTECLFARELPQLVAAGVLAPLVSERIVAPMALARIASRQGDYAGPALALEAERREVVGAIVQAAAARIRLRPGPALCFAVTVRHAQALHAAFARAGLSVACVWGEQDAKARAAAFAAWRSGEIQLLVNCAIVSEGIDLPALRTIVIARPTRSRRLYQQIIGRGARLAPGKIDCLILEACAVQPDPRQVMLRAFVPERVREGGGPPRITLLDPDAAGRWSWRLHVKSGAFSVAADIDARVYLIPEPGDAGLWSAVLHHKGEPFRQLAAGRAQAEAMHCAGLWLNQNASLHLASSTRWHAEPASEAQLALLRQHGVNAADLNRGQASDLIGDAIAARLVPLIRERLWPQTFSTRETV